MGGRTLEFMLFFWCWEVCPLAQSCWCVCKADNIIVFQVSIYNYSFGPKYWCSWTIIWPRPANKTLLSQEPIFHPCSSFVIPRTEVLCKVNLVQIIFEVEFYMFCTWASAFLVLMLLLHVYTLCTRALMLIWAFKSNVNWPFCLSFFHVLLLDIWRQWWWDDHGGLVCFWE